MRSGQNGVHLRYGAARQLVAVNLVCGKPSSRAPIIGEHDVDRDRRLRRDGSNQKRSRSRANNSARIHHNALSARNASQRSRQPFTPSISATSRPLSSRRIARLHLVLKSRVSRNRHFRHILISSNLTCCSLFARIRRSHVVLIKPPVMPKHQPHRRHQQHHVPYDRQNQLHSTAS